MISMFCKLCRVGNEPQVRFTSSGTAVMSLSLAYQYGQKGNDGKYPTQWIDASMWGKQAESLQPYIRKGDQVSVSLNDLHIEEYEGKNGKGHKLVGRVVGFDFVDNKTKSSDDKPEAKPASQPNRSDTGFDDDQEIPF